MKNLSPKSIAEVFKWEITENICHLSEIIDWADTEVINREKPPIWMIELSVCDPDKDWNKIVESLNEIPGDFNSLEIWEGIKLSIQEKLKNGQVTLPGILGSGLRPDFL